MAVFIFGDVAIGGVRQYIEIKHADGSHSQMVQVDDLFTGSGAQTFVTGVTFRPTTGELFSTSTPSRTQANTPHDVDWIPDDSGLIVAVVPSSGVLLLRKYDFEGVQLAQWTVGVEVGWGQQQVRISVACDSRTVFYTMSLKKVKRWDIVDGVQLDDYDTLPSSSPYIYGAVRALPGESADDRDIIAPMTLTGQGPQRAICLAPGATFWNTIDNPTDSIYRIEKRLLLDRSIIAPPSPVVTRANPAADNNINLSLACYFNSCFRPRVGFTTVIA